MIACSKKRSDSLVGTVKKLERAKGFEPSTPTLARLCSTPELHPHPERQSDTGPNRLGGGFMTQSGSGCKRLCRPGLEKPEKSEKTLISPI